MAKSKKYLYILLGYNFHLIDNYYYYLFKDNLIIINL